MRARVAIENVTKDLKALVVTELPYQVNKSTLFKRIAELVENKMISDIDIGADRTRDESDRDGMRIVIGLKRGAQPEIVLNQLYKHTQTAGKLLHDLPGGGQRPAARAGPRLKPSASSSTTASTSCSAAPSTCCARRASASTSWKASRSRSTTSTRSSRSFAHRPPAPKRAKTCYAWGKGTEIVITLDRELARHEERGLTLRQVDAILELQLYRLTQLSVDELLKELKRDPRSKSPSTKRSSASEKKLRAVIVKELEDVRDKYGDERRTEIIDESAEIQLEDLIADEQVAVTV